MINQQQVMALNNDSAKCVSKGLQLLFTYDILEFKAQGDEIYLRISGHIPISVLTKLERLSWIIIDTSKQDEFECIYPLS